jgi:pyridoxal phosphate enzyme (YggS family)
MAAMSAEADIPSADELGERYQRLLARLREVSAENGHDPDVLRIVAVTKGWPVEVARAALEAGLTILGENRVQEAEPKVAALPDAEWHFIGRLQANKARRAVRAFAAIHSVDSIELLERTRRLIHDEGRRTRLLLQVNISGEAAKAGVASADALRPEAVAEAREAGITGLMTMAPMGATHGEALAVFRGLHELRDRLREATGLPLAELSMGMSADAEAAAAEGATLVRIGTALFGPRHETAGILRQ